MRLLIGRRNNGFYKNTPCVTQTAQGVFLVGLDLITKLGEEEGCHAACNDATEIGEDIAERGVKGGEDHQSGRYHKAENAMGNYSVEFVENKPHKS